MRMSCKVDSLPNVEGAAGLDPAEKGELEALLEVFGSVRSRNRELSAYYEQENKVKDIGIDTIPDNVAVDERCDWPRKAVTSVAERSRFDGFALADGGQDPALERALLNNALIGNYGRYVPSELTHGCMFATVGRGAGTSAEVRFHTAETAAATWDQGKGRIGSGFVIADSGRTEWSRSEPVPTQVNLHMPGRVLLIKRTGPSEWFAERQQTPIDRPMMEPFCYRATGVKPFGETRITKAVRSIADDVVRTLSYMAVSSAFYAAPQKYLLGLTSEQFEQIKASKWATYIGSIFLSTRDDEGNVPDYGQLAAASPQPYIDLLRTYATMFSGVTGVPLNSLGIVTDNPSSAEAIQAGREDICICAESLNQSNGESLRAVALMAMAVEENKRVEDLSENQKSVMARFRDPSMPSVVSQADAAVKLAGVAEGFGSTDSFWEMVGYDQARTRSVTRQLRQAQARNLVDLAAMTQGGGDVQEA